LVSLTAEAIGPGVHRVRLVVVNSGWLGSAVSERAVQRKAARPLEAELTLPEGARLVAGERKTEAGQLAGRAGERNPLQWPRDESTNARARVGWVIEAPAGGTVTVEARHDRAGTVRGTVELGAH